jgi:kynurenine formamidase
VTDAWGGVAPPRLELAAPVSLGRLLRFDGNDPRHFGAPAPRRLPLVLPGFAGEVRRGASCNCAALELVPHCHGTHTESVAHLVAEPGDACEVAPRGLLPALLLRVSPVDAAQSGEDSDPPPQPGDRLVTRAALRAAWPSRLPFAPRALVLGTGSDADAGTAEAPFLSRQCATELVARGIEHLVVDLPSIDRGHDQGRLCAHRIFFGLPPGSTSLAAATRAGCTITEFAAIPHELDPGSCALQLALPRIAGDAVPSQPLLFRLQAA